MTSTKNKKPAAYGNNAAGFLTGINRRKEKLLAHPSLEAPEIPGYASRRHRNKTSHGIESHSGSFRSRGASIPDATNNITYFPLAAPAYAGRG